MFNFRQQLVALFIAITTSLLASMPTVASERVEYELVLLFDLSPSMFNEYTQHWKLQREGHARALLANKALLVEKQVAIRIIGWATFGKGKELITPMIIRHPADVDELVRRIREETPTKHIGSGTEHHTGIALAFRLPRIGDRLIVDITTDERVFVGLYRNSIRQIQALANARGYIVNGLTIGNEAVRSSFAESLQTQEGFTMGIGSWKDYYRALERKIEREVRAMM